MKTYKIYAGGESIVTDNVLPVNNSYNNEQIAQTYLADSETYFLYIVNEKNDARHIAIT